MLNFVYYHNSIRDWLIAVAIAAAVHLTLVFVERVALVRLRTLAQNTDTQVDNLIADVLSRTKPWFITYLAIYAGSLSLTLPEADLILHHIAVVVIALQVAIWGHHLIGTWVVHFFKQRHADDPGMQTMIGALGAIARFILYSVLLLMALQNMGVEIDTLLAGLGIGGIAVALSVQSILGDLFASLSIVFDRPFLVGDFIILDNGMMGTVKHVGLKTTRVQSRDGEELVISNNDLLKTRIRNFRQMKERIVSFPIRVPYAISYEKLKVIPTIIREVIEAHPRARFEWARLAAFSPSTLDFDVAYYVTNYNWNDYIRIREEIYLEIFRRLEEAGVKFGYPTQTLYVESTSAEENSVAK